MTTTTNRNESYYQVATNKRQQEVLTVLSQLKRATNRELSKTLKLDINRITGRMNELVKADLVEVAGSKFDSETNRTVTVFRIKVKQLELF